MKNTILSIAFSLCLIVHAASGYSQQWQQQLKFVIDVTLNGDEHTLDGFEKIEYINNSPDTLHFIWFHLWPNAYKNDKTAYSEYLLSQDRTDFYFSGKDQKGYINNLNFRVNGVTARMEDHPEHLDIVKVILPAPLAPRGKALIMTSFHVQIPYNFTGNGRSRRHYELKQWYPAPALYDASGWHPVPFTIRPDLKGQPADYEVTIHVPGAYKVTAVDGVSLDSTIETDHKSLRFAQNNTPAFTWSAVKPEVVPVVKDSKPAKKIPAKYPQAKAPIRKPVTQTLSEKPSAGQIPVKPSSGPLSTLISKFFDTTKTKPVSFLPAIGYNKYDGFMAGGVIHNYLSKQQKIRFVAVPVFGTGSGKLNGLARISYKHDLPGTTFKAVELAISGSGFSMEKGLDTLGKDLYRRFTKVTPAVRLFFSDDNTKRHEKWIGFKSFLITETDFDNYVSRSTDTVFALYPLSLKSRFRYLNEVTFFEKQDRALYPYDYKVQVQQAKDFYRVNLTGHYFFNYSKGGGAQLRVFAAKFGYINERDNFSTARYMPKLLANDGDDDYTYSNYFIGRTASVAFENPVIKNGGLAAQQVMLRDGAFKMRTDQLPYLQGRSDNWVASMNVTTTLPYKIIPRALPLKLFLDIGTQSESWADNAESDRFVFDAGLQLSLFHDVITIYVPVVYSKIFKDYFNSFTDNKFLKTITFSIDLRRIQPPGYKKFLDL